ncbi:MAG: NAD-dependent DNA ligase LigA [Lachnospiraceae bacterium]|nr:NAD-dependent DNA ligase LigA [Lachnospiraceae bacterium]
MMDKIARMKELIPLLNDAARAYYQESREIMPNERYDRLYDELLALEAETGTVLAGSPTQRVGYEVVSELPRERHERAALSLDKTKDPAALRAFLGDRTGVLSWKLDGLTVVLTYDGGELQKAVTRGNGEVGEVVTQNAKFFTNLPLRIPYRGHLVLRGEAVIRYSDFAELNEALPESTRYKNPRNLASGSVRQLDPSVTKDRRVGLVAFALIEAEGVDFRNSMNAQLDFLDAQGFETVERMLVTGDTVEDGVRDYERRIATYDIPSDGLVLVMDDIAYGESLGRTAKFPRNAIAFKWQDEMAETKLLYVEWSASRTGLINPVAVFEPVELEGTTVSRASVHNVSVAQDLGLGTGDVLKVYKANMIIPQISENLTRSGTLEIPAACPVCGGKTEIRDEAGVRTLYCTNPECAAKKIKAFDLFVSRNALNLDGLSEATLEKLIDRGFVTCFADLFRMERFRREIASMEGFGEKSAENLIRSAENARETTLSRLLAALGIPGVGVAGGKLLSRHFDGDLQALMDASEEELTAIDGIGGVTAGDITAYFRDERNRAALTDLLSEIRLKPEAGAASAAFEGKTFVITGAVHRFANRDALKAYIEARGGKTASSVSRKTDYLINNDVTSNSTKNRTARELGIPVLSEEDFLKLEG